MGLQRDFAEAHRFVGACNVVAINQFNIGIRRANICAAIFLAFDDLFPSHEPCVRAHR
jgi:hypothetical protein